MSNTQYQQTILNDLDRRIEIMCQKLSENDYYIDELFTSVEIMKTDLTYIDNKSKELQELQEYSAKNNIGDALAITKLNNALDIIKEEQKKQQE